MQDWTCDPIWAKDESEVHPEILGKVTLFRRLTLKNDPEMPGRWIKRLTLGFSSGRDLMVREIEPRVGLCADREEPAWDSLSPSFSAPLLLVLFLSLSQNKYIKDF